MRRIRRANFIVQFKALQVLESSSGTTNRAEGRAALLKNQKLLLLTAPLNHLPFIPVGTDKTCISIFNKNPIKFNISFVLRVLSSSGDGMVLLAFDAPVFIVVWILGFKNKMRSQG